MCHITLHNDHTSSLCSWRHAPPQCVCVCVARACVCMHEHTHTLIQCESLYFLSARQFEKIMELLHRKREVQTSRMLRYYKDPWKYRMLQTTYHPHPYRMCNDKRQQDANTVALRLTHWTLYYKSVSYIAVHKWQDAHKCCYLSYKFNVKQKMQKN